MIQRALVLFIVFGVLILLVLARKPAPTPSEEATKALTPVVTDTEMATAEMTEAATLEVTEEATADVALVGDPARGNFIFHNGLNGAPACSNCHQTSIPGGLFALAPNLAKVSKRAATRIPDMTAAQYLEDSIRNPTDFVVPGYNVSMYPDFAKKYSAQDIADLVAYLMTL